MLMSEQCLVISEEKKTRHRVCAHMLWQLQPIAGMESVSRPQSSILVTLRIPTVD